jgi:hypothetical protein
MKIIIQIIICSILVFSCNKKKETIPQKYEAILIKIGYYPSFHQPVETIINLTDGYLVFYSPSSYSPIPPPPPKENSEKLSIDEENEYKNFQNERPKLKPFKMNLNKVEIDKIKQLSVSLKSDDFFDRNMIPAFDGMSTNIVVLYSNDNLIQIKSLNGPDEKQRKLYTEVLDLLIEKNKNKNDSIILQKIKGYR